MTVWLDLIAAPTKQLGTLEQFGNTVTADVARRVLRYISKKYHPQVDPPKQVSNVRMSQLFWFIPTSISPAHQRRKLLSMPNRSGRQKTASTLCTANSHPFSIEVAISSPSIPPMISTGGRVRFPHSLTPSSSSIHSKPVFFLPISTPLNDSKKVSEKISTTSNNWPKMSLSS
jgi:hypothetical protein